jgi:hypothetical protein
LNDADSVDILRDGRIVASRPGHVSVYSSTTLQREISIDAPSARLEGEREPGKVLVWDAKPRGMSWLVDVDRGTTVRGASGVVPLSASIFRDGKGRLVSWDGKPIL